MRSGRSTALILLVAALVAGCSEPAKPAPVLPPVTPAWQELTLPVPPGKPGRVVLGDAVACGGHWYIVGAINSGTVAEQAGGADEVTRPAVWESADGRAFTPMTLQPLTFYGEQAVMYSAGCRDGVLAVLGAKRGGAHGNPRVTTWFTSAPHTLRQVDAAFSLYGGPFAVNVAHIAGGPNGWLISGNRTTGAAVWNSPDAKAFTITENTAPLASTDSSDRNGKDAVWHDGTWIYVGGVIQRYHIDRDPIAWHSADGTQWTQDPAPNSGDYDEMQRVAASASDVVAVGVDGATFRAWSRHDGAWRLGGRFGSTAGTRPPFVAGLAAIGSTFVATVASAEGYAAWVSGDAGETWRELRVPVALAAGSDRNLVAAGVDGTVLLLSDDAATARVWTASLPSMS